MSGPKKPSEVLRGAIKQIRRRGWMQGAMYGRNRFTGPVCAFGACRAALNNGDASVSSTLPSVAMPQLQQSTRALAIETCSGGDLFRWNDTEGRTRRQVLSAMGRAARSLEAEGR